MGLIRAVIEAFREIYNGIFAPRRKTMTIEIGWNTFEFRRVEVIHCCIVADIETGQVYRRRYCNSGLWSPVTKPEKEHEVEHSCGLYR